MNRILFSAVIAFVTMLVASSANSANAQGIHVGAGPVHVDLGHPHRSYYQPVQGGYARYGYGNGGGYGAYHARYRPTWRGQVDWHDTAHYDYHPGGYVPQYNQGHYVPSHFDVHQSGHWDGHH